MGHPSDWDEVRASLGEYETSAIAIEAANSWDEGIHELAKKTPERSVLIGYSMGARLALALALEFSERYEALVFISGNPGLKSDVLREQRSAHDARIAERLESEPRIQFLTEWYESPVFNGLSPSVRAEEIQRKAARSGHDWPAILRTNSVAKQPNYWNRLSELAIPVLALAGALDPMYAEVIERFDGACDSACAEIIPDCGHIVHREQPRQFIRVLREFLARLGASTKPH